MSLPKIADSRKLNDQELEARVLELKRQLFDLRFKKGTRQLDKPHQFKHIRHEISQLLTVERERQITAVEAE
ncbi:MAG: 50S ribosomal protein L29 [Alkalinema sp. FL-bin-369]|jgi:large subunit ribosomal protein L29|nr:50S ribosomal protein L29 [Leptolyngbyaceae cyanobacterium LF-bin-369]